MIKVRACKIFALIITVLLPLFCYGAGPSRHPNGKLAWSGGNAYHDNGKTAWYGSKGSNVYHSNGKTAWYGYKSSNLYHSNGKTAWYGYKSSNIYHSNGKTAWYGYKGSNVYHPNGKIAWYGYKGASCYDEEGKYIGIANSVWVSLGDESWLYISAEDNDDLFKIELFLGPGLYLTMLEDKEQYLDIYDTRIDLTK
jgi:hypothetical protein